jgi:protocatechuate 4,5-dioxygenase, alpha chain
MSNNRDELEKIPGTFVFNRDRCREGFHLNMFFTSLLKPENREAFLADEKKYLAGYKLSAEQRRCVLERDWSGMLKVGGNIYHMSKLGGTDKRSFQYLAGCMSGMSQEQYREMMLNGGRRVEGTSASQANQGGK